MPTEPNHKMHDALQAYARKRRDQMGPPFELNSATRQRLQSEVSRTFRESPGSRPAAQLFSLQDFWPRFLLGGFAVAALVAGAGLWLRLEQERDARSVLAKDSNLFFFAQSGAETLVRSAATESNTLAERVRGFEMGLSKMPPTRTSAGVAAGAGQPASPTVNPVPESSRVNLALSLGSVPDPLPTDMFSNAPHYDTPFPRPAAAEGATQMAALAAAAPAIRPTSAQALADADLGTARFQQVDSRARYRQNLNSPPSPNVLTTFEVRRAGRTLQIVDADGSVYEGALQPAPANASQNQRSDGFSFRTAGTNVTLNQLVVFTGQFDPNAAGTGDILPQDVGVGADAGGSANRASEKTLPAPQRLGRSQAEPTNRLGQGRIEGKAAVGTGNELKIEAQQIAR